MTCTVVGLTGFQAYNEELLFRNQQIPFQVFPTKTTPAVVPTQQQPRDHFELVSDPPINYCAAHLLHTMGSQTKCVKPYQRAKSNRRSSCALHNSFKSERKITARPGIVESCSRVHPMEEVTAQQFVLQQRRCSFTLNKFDNYNLPSDDVVYPVNVNLCQSTDTVKHFPDIVYPVDVNLRRYTG